MTCSYIGVMTQERTCKHILARADYQTESFLTDVAATAAFVGGDLVEIDAATGVASHAPATPTAGKRIGVVMYDFDARASAAPNQTLKAAFLVDGGVFAQNLTRAGVALTAGEILAYRVPASIQGIELV